MTRMFIDAIEPAAERSRLVRLTVDGGFGYEAGQAIRVCVTGDVFRGPYSIACSPAAFAESGQLDLLVGLPTTGPLPALLNARPGTAVMVDRPTGVLTLPSSPWPGRLVFVAGGTGIAPVRALVDQALRDSCAPEVVLLHSARTAGDLAFSREFNRFARSGQLTLCQTVTRQVAPAWRGRRGRIADGMLTATVGDTATSHCFVCGPPALTNRVVATWLAIGVPAAHIHTEGNAHSGHGVPPPGLLASQRKPREHQTLECLSDLSGTPIDTGEKSWTSQSIAL